MHFWSKTHCGFVLSAASCILATWHVSWRFCPLCISARFAVPKWHAEKPKFAQNCANMCKGSAFYAIPPSVIPPGVCHQATELSMTMSFSRRRSHMLGIERALGSTTHAVRQFCASAKGLYKKEVLEEQRK